MTSHSHTVSFTKVASDESTQFSCVQPERAALTKAILKPQHEELKVVIVSWCAAVEGLDIRLGNNKDEVLGPVVSTGRGQPLGELGETLRFESVVS